MIYAKILVKGKVQGVHYRDFVKSIAKVTGLNGVVRHCHGDVEIELEAKTEADLDEFSRLIDKKKDEKFGINVSSVSIVTKTAIDGARFAKFSVE
jgi:acylphosphatase